MPLTDAQRKELAEQWGFSVPEARALELIETHKDALASVLYMVFTDEYVRWYLLEHGLVEYQGPEVLVARTPAGRQKLTEWREAHGTD